MSMPIRNYSQEVEPVHETREEEENSITTKMIENIQNKLLIKKIKHRMFNIEQCYFNPQILTIWGYDQIRSTPGQHWKSRIYTLFCDAYLPHYWILDIWKSRVHNTDEIPNTVYVQMITFQAKMFVKKNLEHFFSYQNTGIHVYD
jgi:hypothetical protein